MALGIKSKEQREQAATLEEITERWKAQIEAVSRAGDALAAELRRLCTIFTEADRFSPTMLGGPGVTALGFELPHSMIARFVGDGSYTTAYQLWREECVRRRWLQ